MSLSSLSAKVVAMIGGTMILLRHGKEADAPPAMGTEASFPKARPQGIPTLKMPTAAGWPAGHTPTAAPGLKVNAFADGLVHPRNVVVLPNGDVLASEALLVPGGLQSVFDYAMQVTLKRAAAMGESPNRVMLLRDADGDGVAEVKEIFLDRQNQPYGLAYLDGSLFVANTDALWEFPFTPGPTKLSAAGTQRASFRPGGHWTRNLILSPDHRRLYVGIGSETNIADNGMEAEEGRAMIQEYDLETREIRPFATGLRNPVGMAWSPEGELFTVVNERDGLGDETPPDYLTSVKEGGFYGWPYCYWGQIVDDRVKQDPSKVDEAIRPDYALGGHTASLGLCWMPEGTLPGYPDGMVIGQHGSWNRSKLSGYRVIFVPFEGGMPQGESKVILSGFLSPDEKQSYGRPVGVAIKDKSLLVADDVGNVVWRVTAA